jgi:hypothetical protein
VGEEGEGGLTNNFAGLLDHHFILAECHENELLYSPHLTRDDGAIQGILRYSACNAQKAQLSNGRALTTLPWECESTSAGHA